MLASCLKAAGPGLIPSVQDDGYGQWEVLSAGFGKVGENSGNTQQQWQIVARFIAEPDSGGIKMLDIAAAVDGVKVPFTFEEDGQIFESVVRLTGNPGLHRFELTPSADPSRPFPTLTVEFEIP